MKYLNKVSSVFSTAALALLMLTGCEGADLYEMTAPDWISDKVDSIANENVVDPSAYVVGAADYSTGWWAEFSKYYVIPDGQTWEATIDLSINPSATNTYKNFAMVITNDVPRDGVGYKEYGAIRFDTQPSGNSEWGDKIDRECIESNLVFDTDTDPGVEKLGGTVNITVDRSNPNAFNVTMSNGTVTKTYKQPSALENLNSSASNTNIRVFLVPEGSFFTFMSSNIEPYDDATAPDKNPVSMTLDKVPAKVDEGTSIEDAMAGVTATVTFDDGSMKIVTAEELTFSAIPNMDEPGEKTLIVIYNKTYKGENAETPIVANATFKVVPKIASIAITAMPTQLDYVAFTSPKTKNLGYPLNPAGLEVTATYINGDQAKLELNELIIGSIKAEVGQQEVTISSENGKTATLKVNVTAVKTATDMIPEPTSIGAKDLSTAFWGELTQNTKVPSGKIYAWYFTNYGSGVNNWENWYGILRNGIAQGEDGYTEYAVLRSDNYGWGIGYENNANLETSGGQADWAVWNKAINGGKVAVYVENKGDGTADLTAVMQGTNGNYYLQYYKNVNVDADDLNVAFTVERSHLVFE